MPELTQHIANYLLSSADMWAFGLWAMFHGYTHAAIFGMPFKKEDRDTYVIFWPSMKETKKDIHFWFVWERLAVFTLILWLLIFASVPWYFALARCACLACVFSLIHNSSQAYGRGFRINRKAKSTTARFNTPFWFDVTTYIIGTVSHFVIAVWPDEIINLIS